MPDTTASALSASYSDAFIKALPTQRNFYDIIAVSPDVSAGTENSDRMVAGGSNVQSNNWFIDGIETTRRIMSSHPVPVVVCTASTTFDQVSTAMGALEAGALALLKKPGGFSDPDAETEIAAIISAQARSAVASVNTPGVLPTTGPRRVASGTSTLS